MLWSDLDDRRAVLSIKGDDVDKFLQGIITQDITKLKVGKPLLSAALSPQGKFLYDFIMIRKSDDLVLFDCQRDRIEDLKKHLSLYKLRADISLAIAELSVVVLFGDAVGDVQTLNEDGLTIYQDPRNPEMGIRIIADRIKLDKFIGNIEATKASAEEYDYLRISNLVAEGSLDAVIDKTIILENNYDKMDGVSFTKGCYIGQEITARSHHVGNIKKKLTVVKSQNGDALPSDNPNIVSSTGFPIGELRSVSRDIGLAMIRSDRLAKTLDKSEDILAGNMKIQII